MLARALGRAWCAVDAPRRAAVEANRAALAADFPAADPFVHYVTSLLGWLRLLGLDRAAVARATTIEGLEPLIEAARAGRGTVLVAAHVGEWEWGAAAIAAAGLPVVAVAGVQLHASWTPALRRAKEKMGIEVVGPDVAPVRLARALARGAVVALLIDGDVVTATALAPVAGHAVALPRGPARLAARFGARLVAGRCARIAGRPGLAYAIRLTPLDEPAADEAVLHARVAAWLEATVREAPGAWCLFRPFFPGPAA